MSDEYVTLSNVEVGVDSPSGLAVSVKINGQQEWVPYSQIRAIHRDTKSHDNDRIEVARWLAEKREWV